MREKVWFFFITVLFFAFSPSFTGANPDLVLLADLNEDNTVSLDDFFILGDQFGQNCTDECGGLSADFNGDKAVNFDDFFILGDEFGLTVTRLIAPLVDQSVELGSSIELTLVPAAGVEGELAYTVAPLPLMANARFDQERGTLGFTPSLAQAGQVFSLTFATSQGTVNDCRTISIEVLEAELARWEPRAPMPTARGSLVAAVLNGAIHVVGGTEFWSGGTPFRVNQVYDPANDSWDSAAQTPDGDMWGPAAVVVDGQLHLMGGWPLGGARHRVYDPVADSWDSKEALPAAYSFGHTAALVDDQIFIIGEQTRRYDTVAQTWSEALSAIPNNNLGLAATNLDGMIYVVGSATKLQIYSPADDSWTEGAQLPQSVVAPSVVSYAGKMYLFGGSSNSSSGDLSEVWIYDPASNSWGTGGAMPTSRSWSAAVVFGGDVYVFGGFGLDSSAEETAPNERFVLSELE